MRIGILTFHNVPNYGASLQAYALSSFLKTLYKDVNIIDYQGIGNNDCFSIENNKKMYYRCSNIKKLINRLRFKLFVEKPYEYKYNKFKKFRNDYFDLSSYNKNISNKFDFLFFGSDQIWNPRITHGFDEVLFANNSGNKNISYAASIGSIENITAQEKGTFLKLLENFKNISVRENELKEYIEINSKLKCNLVVDPVFLLCKKEYLALIEREKGNIKLKLPEKYLLLYQLKKYPKTKEVAKKIAKEKNLKIIELAGCNSGWYSGKNTYNDCGPLEFLYMMSRSEYIITNSFHGAAFSILFNKDFNVIESRTGTSRILNLLQVSNLSSRLIKENQPDYDYSHIDYDGKLQNLNILKNESIKFIRISLNENE